MSVSYDTNWMGTLGSAITSFQPQIPASGYDFTFHSGSNSSLLTGDGYVTTGTGTGTNVYTVTPPNYGLLYDLTFSIRCKSDLSQQITVMIQDSSGYGFQCGIEYVSGSAVWFLNVSGPLHTGGYTSNTILVNPVAGQIYNCRLKVNPYESVFVVDGVTVGQMYGTDYLGITNFGCLSVSMQGNASASYTAGYHLGRIRLSSGISRPAGRTISSGLQTTLSSPTMCLALCILLNRSDGVNFGFTTHDQNITLSGMTYDALGATTTTNIRNDASGQPDNFDMTGILTSSAITEDDLRAGLYDNALITIYLVDWSNISLGSVTLFRGNIGDVTIQNNQFQASVRSLLQRLQQQVVELTSPTCRVFRLGDNRCKFDTTGDVVGGSAATTYGCTVTSVIDEFTLQLSGMVNTAGFYTRGEIIAYSGSNYGYAREIKLHADSNALDEPVIVPSPSSYTALSYKGPLTFTPSQTVNFSIPNGVWQQATLNIKSKWSLISLSNPGTDQLCAQLPVGANNDIVFRQDSGQGIYTDIIRVGDTAITTINTDAGSTFSVGLRHTSQRQTGGALFQVDINNISMTLLGSLGGTSNQVFLHEPFPYPVQVGDTFALIVGCDRQRSTCGMKFNNVVNFRGEPDLPGMDRLIQVGRSSN